MAIPGTASSAQARAEEIVVAYARRAGAPLNGGLPCRLALSLKSSRLLGAWASRGLEQCGPVQNVADDHLLLGGGDASGAFDAATKALLDTGATVLVSEAQGRERFMQHVREQIGDATSLGSVIVPREIVLRDRDSATLTLSQSPDAVTIVRTSEDREAC
jgi:hypothetical protein